MDRSAIEVSFVIPVRNDATRLARCLRSISANDFPHEAVEVIVADNGSSDGSGRVAAAMGARVLSLADLSVSEVRNRAAAEAGGRIIAFVDADHEIAPTWISTAVEILEEDGVGAAGALCSAPPDGTWVQHMYGALRGRTEGRSDVSWLGAGNLAVTRQAFDSIAGFDSSLESCEDVDLCQRLRAARWRVVGDARLGNIHLGDPATLAALFRAERWRGRDNLRVTFRGPLRTRDLPSALIPVIDACAIALAGVGVVTSPLIGARTLALTAAGGALVLTASTLRALRMAVYGRLRDPLAFAQAVAVALTYDLGRSIALLTRAGHHRSAGDGAQGERAVSRS
jgi:hypothetical protein